MKSKDNEKNITRRPRLSVVNSGVTKSKGVYTGTWPG